MRDLLAVGMLLLLRSSTLSSALHFRSSALAPIGRFRWGCMSTLEPVFRPRKQTQNHEQHFHSGSGHLSPYSATRLLAKPKRGSVVESYRTVSVNCAKCRERLFRYKKKNGTKSNLIKCYVERIAEDSAGLLAQASSDLASSSSSDSGGDVRTGTEALAALDELPHDYEWKCPSCQTQFARSAQIHGLPALKLVGGKVTMTKK